MAGEEGPRARPDKSPAQPPTTLAAEEAQPRGGSAPRTLAPDRAVVRLRRRPSRPRTLAADRPTTVAPE